MTELSEVPPVVVDPVPWLARSLIDVVDPAGTAAPEVAHEVAPDAVRRRTSVWWALPQVLAVCAAAVADHLLRGGSGTLTAALAVLVLTVALRSGRPSRLGRSGVATSLQHLLVGYAAVSAAVVTTVLSTGALPQAAVLFTTAAVVLVATAYVHERVRTPLRVVVVGDRAAVSRAAMLWGASSRVDVVGGVLMDRPHDGRTTSVAGVPAVAGVEVTLGQLRSWRTDVVLVAPGPCLTSLDIRQLSWELAGSGVELGVFGAIEQVAPHRVAPVRLAGGTVLRLRPPRPPRSVRVAKHVLDRTVGGLLLLLALPVIGVLVLAVRLDSPGPGIFRQRRVGRDGSSFTMLKLRTMHEHADSDLATLAALNEADGPLFKLHDDPRVTRLGRVLRRTSLDELPQLLNVVRGEMSLVGPRPALPSEVASYDGVERRRLQVMPGLTGLWQVSGRSDLGWSAGMALDLRYADNWRLRGDAWILARTLGAVVRRRGAY